MVPIDLVNTDLYTILQIFSRSHRASFPPDDSTEEKLSLQMQDGQAMGLKSRGVGEILHGFRLGCDTDKAICGQHRR